MTSNAAVQTEAPALVACTISRDVQIFDLLIEDMETALGETWGDLSFNDAIPFLQQPEAETLKFFALAMDHEDEANIDQIMTIIAKLCWNSLLTQKQWTASPSCKRCCHTSRS